MKRLIFLLVLALSGRAAWSQTDTLAPSHEQRWQQAGTAYINNDFRRAVDLYEGLLADSVRSSRLYYNLANAYFKEGRLARSILNYHRALRLDPADEDARHNLAVAEGMTHDTIEAVPEFFAIGWWRVVRHLMSSNGWAIFSLVSLILVLGCVLCFLLSRRLLVRKAGFYAGITLLFFLVIGVLFAAEGRREALDRTAAIVMHEAVAVKSSPSSEATDLFILHEGARVRTGTRHEQWSEITIADGKKGWMESDKLEAI